MEYFELMCFVSFIVNYLVKTDINSGIKIVNNTVIIFSDLTIL